MVNINSLLRENIKNLKPYTSARDTVPAGEFTFLDANENSFGSAAEPGLNRYPDPYQRELKEKLAEFKGVPQENIFLGNGSDEAIDLLIRAFCSPGEDAIIICPPTYGVYKVFAETNQVEVKKVPLTSSFQLNIDAVKAESAKLLFLCSPNNPTANCFELSDIETLLESFPGIVVVDEAYADFALDKDGKEKTSLGLIEKYNNLVVLQTFSKAWGMAGLRVGMAFANSEIVEVLSKIKLPYNLSNKTQELVTKVIEERVSFKDESLAEIFKERELLLGELPDVEIVSRVFPSEANFILFRVDDAKKRYRQLLEKGIVVRDRSSEPLCENCLRVTVGTPEENKQFLDTLKGLA